MTNIFKIEKLEVWNLLKSTCEGKLFKPNTDSEWTEIRFVLVGNLYQLSGSTRNPEQYPVCTHVSAWRTLKDRTNLRSHDTICGGIWRKVNRLSLFIPAPVYFVHTIFRLLSSSRSTSLFHTVSVVCTLTSPWRSSFSVLCLFWFQAMWASAYLILLCFWRCTAKAGFGDGRACGHYHRLLHFIVFLFFIFFNKSRVHFDVFVSWLFCPVR